MTYFRHIYTTQCVYTYFPATPIRTHFDVTFRNTNDASEMFKIFKILLLHTVDEFFNGMIIRGYPL